MSNDYTADIGHVYGTEIEAHTVLEYMAGDYEFLKDAIARCASDKSGRVSVQVTGYIELTLPGWENHDVDIECNVELGWDDLKYHVAEEISNLVDEVKDLNDKLKQAKDKAGAFEVELNAAEKQGFVRQSHYAIESK